MVHFNTITGLEGAEQNKKASLSAAAAAAQSGGSWTDVQCVAV